MLSPTTLTALLLGAGAQGAAIESPSDPCRALARLELPAARVISAQVVAAGAFTPPPNLSPWLAGDPELYKTLPAFCRAVVKATPSADSDITIEVWIPSQGWNGKLRGQGNGGFAGEIDFQGMAAALAKGYATAGTDTGHSGVGTDASWALGHPEKVADFGFRAIHVMTQTAKAAIKAYHGRGPKPSYFGGCSNGGRQGLMEAQRFPGDYDGILAGAPANFWTHLLTKALADAQATGSDVASYIPAAKVPAIARAANAACDAQDGRSDGIIDDPSQCRFDPLTLVCPAEDSNACLTSPQASALQALYKGLRDARGREVFPGYLPGAEEGEGGWVPWITGLEPGKSLLFVFAVGYFRNMVYERADWDYRSANVPDALQAAEGRTAEKLDANDPDLSAYAAGGAKLILYHGWNDPAIAALNSIHYYDSVVEKLGHSRTQQFMRLYMVPGMQHCGGGPGAYSLGQWGPAAADDAQHNVMLALEDWVENGRAPDVMVATKYKDDVPAKGVAATRELRPR